MKKREKVGAEAGEVQVRDFCRPWEVRGSEYSSTCGAWLSESLKQESVSSSSGTAPRLNASLPQTVGRLPAALHAHLLRVAAYSGLVSPCFRMLGEEGAVCPRASPCTAAAPMPLTEKWSGQGGSSVCVQTCICPLAEEAARGEAGRPGVTSWSLGRTASQNSTWEAPCIRSPLVYLKKLYNMN